MVEDAQKCSFLLFLMMSINRASLSAPCAHFKFPTLNGSLLTVEEHSTLALPFKIEEGDCKITDDFSITVTKIQKQALTQCLMTVSDRRCEPTFRMPKCTCASDTGVYLFTDVIDRSDNTTWVWSTDNLVAERNITFNVLYPADVIGLLVLSREEETAVPPNTPVDIICSWDEGNPPVTARLLDRHGVEMEGNIYGREIRYRFPAVGCQDAGLIRCEAPGASHNQTATLLVRCPPKIQLNAREDFKASVGSRFIMKFHLRSHTREITQCKLKFDTVIPAVITAIVNCSRLMEVSGFPPDLMLTVRLNNVRKQLEGQWRLELTNEAGSGHLDFYFHVTESTGHTSMTSTRTLSPITTHSKEPFSRLETKKSSVVMYIATIIAIVLVVGIISLSVTVICIKKAARTNAVPVLRQEIQLVERPRHPTPRHNAGSSESIHTYEEVRERPFRRFISWAAAFRPATRRCQAPLDDPEDYLHPAASPSDTETTAHSSDTNEQSSV